MINFQTLSLSFPLSRYRSCTHKICVWIYVFAVKGSLTLNLGNISLEDNWKCVLGYSCSTHSTEYYCWNCITKIISDLSHFLNFYFAHHHDEVLNKIMILYSLNGSIHINKHFHLQPLPLPFSSHRRHCCCADYATRQFSSLQRASLFKWEKHL